MNKKKQYVMEQDVLIKKENVIKILIHNQDIKKYIALCGFINKENYITINLISNNNFNQRETYYKRRSTNSSKIIFFCEAINIILKKKKLETFAELKSNKNLSKKINSSNDIQKENKFKIFFKNLKNDTILVEKKDTPRTVSKRLSQVLYLLSQKYKKNINETFLNEQIKFFVLKNNIKNPNILNLVSDNNIKIDDEDYQKESKIKNMEKLINLYMAIEMFYPLDLIFYNKKQYYNRYFFKKTYEYIRYKDFQKKIKFLNQNVEKLEKKFTIQKQKSFDEIRWNYSSIKRCEKFLNFIGYFFRYKKRLIYYSFLKKIQRMDKKKWIFTVLHNLFHRSKFLNFMILKLMIQNMKKIKNSIKVDHSLLNSNILHFMNTSIEKKNTFDNNKRLCIFKNSSDIINFTENEDEGFPPNKKKQLLIENKFIFLEVKLFKKDLVIENDMYFFETFEKKTNNKYNLTLKDSESYNLKENNQKKQKFDQIQLKNIKNEEKIENPDYLLESDKKGNIIENGIRYSDKKNFNSTEILKTMKSKSKSDKNKQTIINNKNETDKKINLSSGKTNIKKMFEKYISFKENKLDKKKIDNQKNEKNSDEILLKKNIHNNNDYFYEKNEDYKKNLLKENSIIKNTKIYREDIFSKNNIFKILIDSENEEMITNSFNDFDKKNLLSNLEENNLDKQISKKFEKDLISKKNKFDNNSKKNNIIITENIKKLEKNNLKTNIDQKETTEVDKKKTLNNDLDSFSNLKNESIITYSRSFQNFSGETDIKNSNFFNRSENTNEKENLEQINDIEIQDSYDHSNEGISKKNLNNNFCFNENHEKRKKKKIDKFNNRSENIVKSAFLQNRGLSKIDRVSTKKKFFSFGSNKFESQFEDIEDKKFFIPFIKLANVFQNKKEFYFNELLSSKKKSFSIFYKERFGSKLMLLENIFGLKKKAIMREVLNILIILLEVIEVLEVQDLTKTLEPQILIANNSYSIIQNGDRNLNKSKFDNSILGYINKSTYFTPENQVHRYENILKTNISKITTIGDINNDDNLQSSYILKSVSFLNKKAPKSEINKTDSTPYNEKKNQDKNHLNSHILQSYVIDSRSNIPRLSNIPKSMTKPNLLKYKRDCSPSISSLLISEHKYY